MSVCISDQGKEFNNSVVEQLFKLPGCRHHMMSTYHPQGNGTGFTLDLPKS